MLPAFRPESDERLRFGARIGEIMQVAHVVPDIHRAMEQWTGTLGIGPFFHFPHFPLLDARYRGQPTEFDVDIALAYSGGMCFELIQQNNAVPSVYNEVVEKRGYGFHHWAVSTRDFDGLLRGYESMGYSIVLTGTAAVGARAAYVDTTSQLGGMIEVIELKDPVEALFSTIRDASESWDGSAPVRAFDG